jgi:hypothetical protein
MFTNTPQISVNEIKWFSSNFHIHMPWYLHPAVQ